ncbi:hypothetical protein WME76_23945 [Sorangium sp. So ce119]|uniref:hypothetical protein n=1 Tax=Sorangium sp. So ce119 TaxID=3133279 RepID=UPI003F62B3C6
MQRQPSKPGALAGATVLVTAGAGGVGHLEVQLARHLGLRVVGRTIGEIAIRVADGW